ncbi:hypothetical protein SKAU_G00425030 [Synaphobranchus kaupii]|uniref:Uncharacterized protein n=1 Tax=Synaphobranchus kaupii TaxID=118154 RepID=A0A9Q1IAQ0_SYNKA|nr:hypothetical protein SKAU_G00425030 [Synaphobranchus kaupii]
MCDDGARGTTRKTAAAAARLHLAVKGSAGRAVARWPRNSHCEAPANAAWPRRVLSRDIQDSKEGSCGVPAIPTPFLRPAQPHGLGIEQARRGGAGEDERVRVREREILTQISIPKEWPCRVTSTEGLSLSPWPLRHVRSVSSSGHDQIPYLWSHGSSHLAS